jgi:hypothetical protein
MICPQNSQRMATTHLLPIRTESKKKNIGATTYVGVWKPPFLMA